MWDVVGTLQPPYTYYHLQITNTTGEYGKKHGLVALLLLLLLVACDPTDNYGYPSKLILGKREALSFVLAGS